MRLVVFEQRTDEAALREHFAAVPCTPGKRSIIAHTMVGLLAVDRYGSGLLAELAEVGSIVTRRVVQAQQRARHVG
ncbi:hypothetical protein GWE18_16835 [Bradyrhizobium sp. CSA112]|uniref:hypothetical protein n=1 Tax=Bradyrhizobium sp. CSA112 TaxID=2699170 RepID=UPI0023AEB971|nr:hypothetical protein [Bradyrhizobium sp. CSA112]MDE5454475.1 hypothetical protein [Bradyrhizobium sp. CSA112]